jgi:hypothetical protein
MTKTVSRTMNMPAKDGIATEITISAPFPVDLRTGKGFRKMLHPRERPVKIFPKSP